MNSSLNIYHDLKNIQKISSFVFLFLFLSLPLLLAATNEDCKTCHEDPGLKTEEEKSLFLDIDKFNSSIHGEADFSVQIVIWIYRNLRISLIPKNWVKSIVKNVTQRLPKISQKASMGKQRLIKIVALSVAKTAMEPMTSKEPIWRPGKIGPDHFL